jgi:2-methylcitrate dehydratase PrpD
VSTAKVVPSKETITAHLARWAAGLEFQHLSRDAVYQAKRFLLDSLGCALGGYQQHDVKIALAVLDEVAGRGPATVIGTGKRVDAVSASLANALMIRCMDYNDIYWKQDPSHPSDIFPAAMAACERVKSGGKELIVGFVLGHEFEMRLCEAAFPAPCDADGLCLALCGRARAALAVGEDSACGRDLGQPALHAGRGHRGQAHHDEEHG